MPKKAAMSAENLLPGGGQMGAFIRAFDWSTTPLGAIETWSHSLRAAIRLILESRYPMFIWWGRSLINIYNDAYIPILGQRHPDALGQTAPQVWSDIWGTVGPQAEAVLREGRSSWNEELLLIMQRSGYSEETYFTFSYSPVASDDGKIGGVFCTCTEDTHRVLSDRRLRTLRELAAATVAAKTIEDACKISAKTIGNNPYDVPFALLYLLNDTASEARLVGSTGLAIGTSASPTKIKLGETSEQWGLSAVLAHSESQVVEHLRSRFGDLPGGAWTDPPDTALVLPLTTPAHARLAGFLIVGISPRRALDDDYKGFFDLVAGQITTAIATARAYEAERQRAEALAEIDRAKTVFFSNVSHEFRTPLTLMLAPTEEALFDAETPLPSVHRERIELVQRNGLRLLKLVNTLLDFSRIEAGRLQAVYEPTDLSTFTSELASTFRSLIEQAGMNLVVECPPVAKAIYVDREMWEKIVFNLLSNAFKFTFTGAITVRLQYFDDYVDLSVEDTGIGISPHEIPHLFKRFHQVKGAQGRSFEGSGIGLSLVQELVELHGGVVSVTSHLGQGSCFIVSIPTGATHLPSESISPSPTATSTTLDAAPYIEEAFRWLSATTSAATEEPAGQNVSPPVTSSAVTSSLSVPLSTTASAPIAPARILLADDNADMRQYVERLLSSRYDVQAVADGFAALTAIRQHRPDLVLTDIMMPKLDGFDLLRQLRSNAQTRDIPIILLSARAGEDARIEGLEAEADDYLIKPFAARELLARVEATLKLVQIRQAGADALRQSEARFRQLAETIQDVFWMSNPDQQELLYVSPAYEKIWGRSYEGLEITYEDWLAAIHPHDRERVRALYQQVLRQEYDTEYRVMRPDGSMRWVRDRGFPVREANGQIYRAAGIAEDITERKQAEEVKLFMAAIVESSNDAIIGFTPDGRIVSWNASARRIFGYSTEEILGQHGSVLAPLDRLQEPQQIFAMVRRGEAVVHRETIRQRKDGGLVDVSITVSPIKDATNQMIGVSATLRDITKQKQIEFEREQLLQRERHAREEAETANRIKDEFLAMLSHELRTPLNPILGWTRILRSQLKASQNGGSQNGARSFNPQTADQALATIERNATLQTQLIEDLLDISRILRGQLSLNVAPVDLTKVIQSAIETVHLAAEAKAIPIQFTVHAPRQLTDCQLMDGQTAPHPIEAETNFDGNGSTPAALYVMGDAARLQQVVWNLLSNAVKFTPEGGRIEVELSSNPSQGSNSAPEYGQITVRDTGKGINPEFLPYVFESFRQEDSRITRRFGGLGLGLAIVRNLVELHGGTVSATSPGEGQGTTFTVQVPLIKRPVHQSNGDSSPSSVTTLSNLRVLVVDDEPDMRDLTAAILAPYTAQVKTAASATEALALLKTFQPEVLISDVGMPEVDGYSLMRHIRTLSIEQGGDIFAIALTAYAGAVNQKQALDAGFQCHLAKPIDPDELIRAVAKFRASTAARKDQGM
jgi:PAS domain S-box-containing protein